MARPILSHPTKPTPKPVPPQKTAVVRSKGAARVEAELEKLISSHQDRVWQAIAVLKVAVKAVEQNPAEELSLDFAMDAAVTLLDPVAAGLSLESLRHTAICRAHAIKREVANA